MTDKTQKPRRWLKSAIAAASRETVALPFQRGTRRRPATLTAPERPVAVAAR